MGTKYTPGPWTVWNGPKDTRINSNTWWQLATVYTIVNEEQNAEGMANAALIAAAPELAEALREIANHLYNDQDYARVRDMARAALKKAGIA